MKHLVMHFRGKEVDETMTKVELLEVIDYLAAEMNHYKKEVHDNQDAILKAKIGKL